MKIIPLFLAFYVLLGSLFPKTDFSQLGRLVNAAHHYRVHLQEARSQGEQMTFREFWTIHYLDPGRHQGAHEQDHGQLPFHSITSFVFHNLTQVTQKITTAAILLEPPKLVFQNKLHLTGFPHSIFIPPSTY